MGLSKPGKVALTNVSQFKTSDNLNKWMESIWTCILLHQGGAALQHWVHEANYLDNGLQLLPNVLHTAVDNTPRDADTATLKVMVERGELPGALQSFTLGRACVLGISDEVKLLLEMLIENEGDTRDKWIDRWATIVKVEDHRFLIHSKADRSVSEQVEWFESAHVC